MFVDTPTIFDCRDADGIWLRCRVVLGLHLRVGTWTFGRATRLMIVDLACTGQSAKTEVEEILLRCPEIQGLIC